MIMSTPAVVPPGQNRTVLQGDVITPSAIAGKVDAAAYGLGQILKTIIGGLPSAFRTENELLAGYNAVDKYIAAVVSQSAIPALATGEEMASIEDVTTRRAPNQSAYTLPQQPAVAIDYDRLAEAMVRAQMQIQAENARQPETTLVEDKPAPAPATNTGVTYERASA
jgi:hypothetical protein